MTQPLRAWGAAGSACGIALAAGAVSTGTTTGTYRGLVVENTSTVDRASVDIYDNASAASGVLLAAVQLAPGESVDVQRDRVYRYGLFVAITGTVAGAVYVG